MQEPRTEAPTLQDQATSGTISAQVHKTLQVAYMSKLLELSTQFPRAMADDD